LSTDCRSLRQRSRGFTLVDVLLLIVLLGVMGGGLTLMSGQLAVQSAQAMKTRQMLALAQGLLDEVVQAPFMVAALGPTPGQTRYASAGTTRFDSVTDYHGFQMPAPGCAALCDRDGNVYGSTGSALAGCSARVDLRAQAVTGIPALDATGLPQSLLVAVTVTCPAMDPLVVQAIRIRDAPNQL
jgi:hypothetical protein